MDDKLNINEIAETFSYIPNWKNEYINYIKTMESPCKKVKVNKKNATKIVGFIEEKNVYLLNGMFKLYDTIGLPLTIIIEELSKRNLGICWTSFIKEARNAGWKEKTITSRIEESLVEFYGREYWEQWNYRYSQWIRNE